MATENFQTFAESASLTDIYTDAQYIADADMLGGNKAGIAKRKLVNKALKQATKITAAVAKFIADNQANNITDATSKTNLATYLQDAVKALEPFASNAEAQAFSSTVKKISPSTLAQAFKGANQTLAANGYQIFPGGLIVQWGQATTNASGIATVTYPIAFPNLVFSAATSDSENVPANAAYGSVALTSNTTLTLAYAKGGVALNAGLVLWIAFGN